MTSFNETTLQRSFASDNTAGASPEVLAALVRCNAGQAPSYGADLISVRVERRLSEIFERDVAVLLVSTGSAANALGLAALTPPWGGVLAHPMSHINSDECGAPEFFTAGAKLVAVEGASAKLDPATLKRLARRDPDDVHRVQPACVSITQATEVGSVYTLAELAAIGAICREAGLRLHMDGARFANALVALGCTPAQMTWKAGVDVLAFGATKNGVLGAEAIVLFDPALAREMAYRRKRGGHLSSKMRFLAAQMDAYVEGDLWLANARHANAMAARLAAGLRALPGVAVHDGADANILFCRLPNAVLQGLLDEGFSFYHGRWEPGVVRLVTSFATTPADVDDLLGVAGRLCAV